MVRSTNTVCRFLTNISFFFFIHVHISHSFSFHKFPSTDTFIKILICRKYYYFLLAAVICWAVASSAASCISPLLDGGGEKKNYAGDDLKWVMCKRVAVAHYIDKLVYKQAPTLHSIYACSR